MRLAVFQKVVEDLPPDQLSDMSESEKIIYLYGPRPIIRADCLEGGCNEQRPCPWVSCKYHLGIAINKKKVIEFDGWMERESCALDVADKGGVTLEEIASYCEMTRERIRQIQDAAQQEMYDRLQNPEFWIRYHEFEKRGRCG